MSQSIPVGYVKIRDSYGNYVLDSNGDFVITRGFVADSPNIDLTLISQYAQSPILTQLIDNLGGYFDQTTNWNNFLFDVWSIDTAFGFGLDFWGKVLGVTRYLELAVSAQYLGLTGSDGTSSGHAFDVGVFFDGATATQTYSLPDSDYRTLLLAKAFANIARTCIPVLNQLLMMLFQGYGDAYVEDNGNMQMTYYLGWAPTSIQLAIIEQSGVMPHPTGVAVSVSHL